MGREDMPMKITQEMCTQKIKIVARTTIVSEIWSVMALKLWEEE